MSDAPAARLLSPLTFRNGRTAPNRLWLAPLTNQSSHEDGRISDDELAFLEARAAGGFGIIESCATHVSLDGQGWTGELGLHSDALIPGWRRLAAAVHERGAILIGQAFHGGARALRGPDRPIPWSCSPSEPGEPEVRAATEQDIERTIEAFAAGARRLQEAGADGVELHGAHGYLLCQFLSAAMNRREDRWGGSRQNRARLLRRVMQATRAAVRDDFIVGVRLSPESSPGTPGLDLDESVQVARELCEDGADFIHLSLWDVSRMTQKRPQQHAATIFREALPAAVPIITAGAIWTAAEAAGQLDRGADAVALGRAAITNPDWPQRVLAEGCEPKRPPLTRGELSERAVGPTFTDYLSRWKGFVAEPGVSDSAASPA